MAIKDVSYNKDRFIARISNLKEEDRLYLELSLNKTKTSLISKEGFIKYLKKYKGIDSFWYRDVVEEFSDLDLNEILQNVSKGSKIYSQIQSELIYRQYSKLNKNEKMSDTARTVPVMSS